MMKSLSATSLVVLLLAVLIGGPGCGLFHKKAPPVTYDDAQIKEKVESAMKSEPLLKDSRITVQSQNGVVQLSGEISSLAAKERAGLAAASVPGTLQVKNDLLVRPSQR
jgi:hypothetical protein